MKKNYVYALMSAIALAGTVSFSACSSSDEIVDNPNYNPETKSVKTTITLSINPNNGATTRQSEATVQTPGSAFRGISNILSIPNIGDITTSTSTGRKLSWGDISGFDNSSTNYKLYLNQDIAVGVDHFLFIGKAPATPSSADNKLTNGYTTNNLGSAGTVGDIQIVPGAIVESSDIVTSDVDAKNWKYQSDALVSYLNGIANVPGWSTTTNASLKSMYQQFTRTTNSAGSAESVRLILKDLLDKTAGMTDDIVTGTNGIRAKIETQADVSGTGPYTVAWKSTCEFSGFPTSFGLPEGSAVYVWDATTNPENPTFKYITDGTISAVSTPVGKIVYPNELYYLTKTPLRATSSATVNWPATAPLWASETWSTPSSWSTSVEPTSRNIALKYNINYGSALLATHVRASAETIYDNARQLDPEKIGVSTATNNAIVVKEGDTDKNPFTLTGILVGSQPSAVAWNFLPVSDATFDKAVYDGKINGTINVTTEYNTTPNYTLVFDDYKATAADVNVCLEFKNNLTTSFYGQDGVILPGQTFYIMGKLKVTDVVTNPLPSSTDYTDDALDAYIPNRALRAFIQDYTTTAKFVISAGSETGDGDGSLAHAVTTIPDLRQSSQTIGLSVDLGWSSGVTYSDVILGQ